MQERRDQELSVPFDEAVDKASAQETSPGTPYAGENELALEQLETHAAAINEWVRKHDHELASLLTLPDWLRVYGEGVREHGLDMDHLISGATSPERHREALEEGRTRLSDLQAEFGGDETLTWERLADYAEYVRGLYAAGQKVAEDSHTQENFEKIMEFMTGYDKKDKSKTDNLSRESIFRSFTDQRYNPKTTTRSEDALLSEINSNIKF